MNDIAVTRAEPTPNDWFAKVEHYLVNPWWAIAAGYATMLVAIAFSLSALPALNIARQVFAVIAILMGAWGVWMRLRRPWQGEEPSRIYLWVFLLPLVLISFVVIGALLGEPADDSRVPLLVLLGLLIAGCAGLGIIMRVLQLRKGGGTTHAAAALYSAAGIAALGLFTQEPQWDSGTIVLHVLVALSLIGGFLVALPQFMRRALVSAFFVYHFIGISMAATTLPVQGSPPGWINLQLYQRLYRNYLNFMYLTNAYHYYSPDPGPPQLLYFCIEYEPTPGHPMGQHQWITIPKRENFRTRLEYQRRLGVTESTNDTTGVTPVPLQQFLMNYHDQQCYDPLVPGKHALLLDREEMLSLGLYGSTIRKPSAFSQAMLRTYARYVATHYPLVDDDGNLVPGGKIHSVKIYRVTHKILSPKEFADGKDPLDPDEYFPYFQGDYDPDGNLLENDGFLYMPLPGKWVPEALARVKGNDLQVLYMPLPPGKWVPEAQRDKVIFDPPWKLEPEEQHEVEENGRVNRYIYVNRMRMHAEYTRPHYDKYQSTAKGIE